MPTRILIFLPLFALAETSGAWVRGADMEKITYHARLIRASNDSTPPEPKAKLVGPKVALLLRPFAWSNYWEIARHEIKADPGQKTRAHLNADREIEIDLTKKDRPKLTVFHKGEPIASTIPPVGPAVSVVGGDRDKNTAWFIIVKRARTVTRGAVGTEDSSPVVSR
jgi:hypothetical protein